MKHPIPNWRTIMVKGIGIRAAIAVASFAATIAAAHVQAANGNEGEFKPHVGQSGKDVIWVPTPKSLVQKMLTMAEVKPTDTVFDLGSGDGITVITAAKEFGARATGIEYNPDMVTLSQKNAKAAGVEGKATFQRGDIFATDFSNATVVTMYLLPYLNLKLRPTLLNMKPGTRIVSHAFTMNEWAPDQTDSAEGRTAYLWIVPAKVDGRWRLGDGELELKQSFQHFEGVYRRGDASWRVTRADLRGTRIRFDIGLKSYTGHVSGPVMQGTARRGGEAQVISWSANQIKVN
jgi:hypothetical protein